MIAFKTLAVFGLLIASSGISNARPQRSEAERRALDGQDMFDPNPKYTYTYQISNDNAQTYIAKTETRDGDAVQGEYSFVDPLGNLITVKYQADDVNGYTETREVTENFMTIRSKPIVAPAPAPKPVDTNVDLVAQIIRELTPFIKETVSSTLAEPAPLPAPAPILIPAASSPRVSTLDATFGTGGGNNIRVDTPEYQFATDF